MTGNEFLEEYRRIGHAIQSGIALLANTTPDGEKSINGKHLRVGVNTAKADLGSVGRLLIAKGICTEDELFAAILEGMRGELATTTR